MRALCTIFCLVFVAPFAALALSAFQSADIADWSLHAVELKSVLRSFFLGLCAAIASALLGSALAFAVCFHRFPLKAALEKLLVLPLLFPTFVLGAIYKELFAPSGLLALRGWLPAVLTFDFQSLGGFVFIMSFALFPYVYLFCRIMFETFGGAFFDLGHSVGLTPSQSFKWCSCRLCYRPFSWGLCWCSWRRRGRGPPPPCSRSTRARFPYTSFGLPGARQR